MKPYASSSRRRNATLVTLGIIVVSHVAGVFAALGRLFALQLISGGDAGLEVANASDAFIGCALVLQGAAIVACGIAFLMWFHRVYRNLPALGATNLARTPAGAVGGFFIPIVNLVRPYESMDEIWFNSQLPAADPLLESDDEPLSIKVWWLSWIASNIASNVGAFFFGRSGELSGLRWGAVMMLLSNALAIVAAVCAMILVRRVSTAQDALHRHIEARQASEARAEAVVPSVPA